jgi:hypothetical protein
MPERSSTACRGLYIGNFRPPPPRGEGISTDVIWGKYEKEKRKRGRM